MSRAAGIEMVYQDFALADTLDIRTDVFLGREQNNVLGPLVRVIDRKKMEAKANCELDRLDIPINPRLKVKRLSGGQRQAVAIGGALAFDARLVIMDEPTRVSRSPRWTSSSRSLGCRAVVAHNDEIALGAAAAIRAPDRMAGFKAIVGVDGTPAGGAAIESWDMTATVRKDSAGQAVEAVRGVARPSPRRTEPSSMINPT